MVPAIAIYFCLSFLQQKFYITQVQNVLGQDFKAECKTEACFYRCEKIIAASSSQDVIHNLEIRVIGEILKYQQDGPGRALPFRN